MPQTSTAHSSSTNMTKHTSITLIGTSGIGKTTLAERLSQAGCYHYSGDYRIATHYLAETIRDWLESLIQSPTLQALLTDDAIRLTPHTRIDNLRALSAFIGKLGKTGLDLATFTQRQQQFAAAERAAMFDFATFRTRAQRRLGATRFINDAGGSLCEYQHDHELMTFILNETLPVYIRADAELSQELLTRGMRYPKPICYDPDFLSRMIESFASTSNTSNPDHFDSDAFIRHLLPAMMQHRDERAMALIQQGGIVLSAQSVWATTSAEAFWNLLETACEEQGIKPCR